MNQWACVSRDGAAHGHEPHPVPKAQQAGVALEHKGHPPSLGLADEVDRHEPNRQQELGVLYQATPEVSEV